MARIAQAQIHERIQERLPHLKQAEAEELARILTILLRELEPERIYLFGSRARGDARPGSDVDLLVLLRRRPASAYELDVRARAAIGPSRLPLDLVITDHADFDWRLDVVSSLPATVLREGRLLYEQPATTAA